jgi:hypothetical protein
LRDFLDAILAFIGAESLTDIEFDSLTIDSASYNSATYLALSAILAERESVSTMQDKLHAYFTARGVEVTQASTGRSNIFLGAVL